MKNLFTVTIFTICILLCNGAPTEPTVASAIKLTDLPIELLLSINKYFDLVALMESAKSHPRNQAAAEIIFSDKFLKGTFEIQALPNAVRLSNEEETVVEVQNVHVILEILQTFGHLITNLKVDYELFEPEQRLQINEHLNKFCAQSLIDIELVHCDDEYLMGLHGPFVNAENVKFNAGYIRSNNLRFDQIFPSVRRLDLDGMLYTQAGCFEHHFANLEHLINEFTKRDDDSVLISRLQVNPQLKHVSISQVNWKIIKAMSDMPNLENIEIHGFNNLPNYDGADIHFEHLKSFKYNKYSTFNQSMERIPLVFGHIEELACFNHMDKWMKIIEDNKQIKRIVTGDLTHEQLKGIVVELPELQEFTTNFNVCLNVDKAIDFIRSGHNLKKVAFLRSTEDSRNEILAELNTKWSIANVDGKFLFVRK